MTADRFPPTPGLAESAARVGRAYDAAEKRDDATRARKRMEAAAPDMLAALKAIAGLESRTKADCIGLLKQARHIAKCTIAQIEGGAA